MISRRNWLLSAAAITASASGCKTGQSAVSAKPPTQRQTLSLATGSPGGGFLLYGQALSQVLTATHLQVRVLETQGTAQNINQLNAREVDVALVVMGPAWDAWTGQGSWAGKPVRSLRALLPMYETPFHVAAAAGSGIASLSGLAGKRVGTGPLRGTAQVFFEGLMEATGLQCQLVHGSPNQHAQQLARGEIDAIWFGAGLPIPAFTEAARLQALRIFGLTNSERSAFLRRFPYFSPYQIPAGTYAGQSNAVESVAVWDFLAVREDTPEDLAYWLTRLTLENADRLASIYPAASATLPAVTNPAANTFLPIHTGALRYYRERGLRVVSPA